MHFAEGMADNRFAVIGKVHHALADGVASANLMAKAMDLDGPSQDEQRSLPNKSPPSTGELLAAAFRDHFRQVRKLPRLAQETAAGIGRVRSAGQRARASTRDGEAVLATTDVLQPCHHAGPPVRHGDAVAGRRQGDQQETRHHDQRLGTGDNAGALRELLLRYDGRADAPLIGSVPASLDTSADRLTGNEFLGMNVSLPVHIDDPLERVRLTALAAGMAKEDMRLLGPKMVSQLGAYLPPSVAPAVFRWLSKREAQSKAAEHADLECARAQRARSAGRRDDQRDLLCRAVDAGSGINITVWSYVDQLNISVLTDDVTLEDPHEATDAMVHAFQEIRSAAGLSDQLTEVHTAMAPASAIS